MALVVRDPLANAGYRRDVGSVPGLGRSSGGGHGNPLQYSCLENPTDRGAWLVKVHRVAKSGLAHMHAGEIIKASLIAQLVKNPPAV